MNQVICFFLEPVGRLRRDLRRFRTGEQTCAVQSPKRVAVCDSWVFLDEIDHPPRETVPAFEWPHDDPRWPKNCDRCGQPFLDTDTWQVFCEPLYRRSDNREITTMRDAPAGAMWDAWWYPAGTYQGPDGKCLVLKLPGGFHWLIDGPSAQHKSPGAWTRTGAPPKISVSPSILVHDQYHGWLKDGILTEC